MTDIEIVRRIRAGNFKAYAELIDRYQQAVYASVWRCVENEKATQITVESFSHAYSFLGNVENEADYVVYLFRCMLTQLKASFTDNKNDAVISLYERILQLELSQRRILVFRYIMALSYEQIAQKLGCEIADITTELASARETIVGCGGCDEYRLKIQAYVDNEMMRMERMVVEAHAETCTDCTAAIERIEEIFGENIYVEAPESISSSVMENVKEEYASDADIPSQRYNLSKKLEKNKNLRLWVIVGCVFLFGMFSWLFSLVAENNLEHVPSSSGQEQSGPITVDSFAGELAQSIKESDAIFIEFGFNRVGVTEEAMIMMFADYIAMQPVQEYQGIPAVNSLGKITGEPTLGYSIVITSEHRLLVDDGEQIWELQTTREKLLDTLKALGI